MLLVEEEVDELGSEDGKNWEEWEDHKEKAKKEKDDGHRRFMGVWQFLALRLGQVFVPILVSLLLLNELVDLVYRLELSAHLFLYIPVI